VTIDARLALVNAERASAFWLVFQAEQAIVLADEVGLGRWLLEG